ncbi:MAG: hypothetical protein AAF986_05095 [Pseudomonadota bacterium]
MLTYILVTALIIGAVYGVFRLWQRRIDEDLAIGAKADWEMLSSSDPTLLKGLDEPAFQTIYHKTHVPRFPAYVAAAIIMFLVGTPAVLSLLEAIAYFGLRFGIVPQPGDAATQLYLNAEGASVIRRVSPEALSYILQGWAGFYYFFGMLTFWIGLVYVLMTRYHRRTPGTLREEIIRAR